MQMVRAAIVAHTGEQPPPLPQSSLKAAYGHVKMSESLPILEAAEALAGGSGIAAEAPLIMEEYGQSCEVFIHQ